MRRREFITLLGGATAWPLAAHAQQAAMPVIGILGIRPGANDYSSLIPAFRQGLNEAGYVHGSTVPIDYRGADGRNERFPALVGELVARQVAVIVALSGTPAALAAKAATSEIPIVFFVGGDPIASGIVASYSRPGGNLTGLTLFHVDLTQKRIELLRELVPAATTIAFLANPTNTFTEQEVSEVRDAARSLGMQLHILNARNEREIDEAFGIFVPPQADALLLSADPFLFARAPQVIRLATRHRVPIISGYREVSEQGGLLSYGTMFRDMCRLLGVYTGRILKGEKPADLPVIQPTKFELVINLKAANAIGLTVPPLLLARADEVIE